MQQRQTAAKHFLGQVLHFVYEYSFSFSSTLEFSRHSTAMSKWDMSKWDPNSLQNLGMSKKENYFIKLWNYFSINLNESCLLADCSNKNLAHLFPFYLTENKTQIFDCSLSQFTHRREWEAPALQLMSHHSKNVKVKGLKRNEVNWNKGPVNFSLILHLHTWELIT